MPAFRIVIYVGLAACLALFPVLFGRKATRIRMPRRARPRCAFACIIKVIPLQLLFWTASPTLLQALYDSG